MFVDCAKVKIFLRPGFTDMRKAANGLSVFVQEQMELDPFSGNLFLFCNKRRNIFKALYWDRNGFWLCKKRLEKDKFPWPVDQEGVQQIGEQQLRWLLDGIDFWKAHKKIPYSSVI
jgi:transposase